VAPIDIRLVGQIAIVRATFKVRSNTRADRFILVMICRMNSLHSSVRTISSRISLGVMLAFNFALPSRSSCLWRAATTRARMASLGSLVGWLMSSSGLSFAR